MPRVRLLAPSNTTVARAFINTPLQECYNSASFRSCDAIVWGSTRRISENLGDVARIRPPRSASEQRHRITASERGFSPNLRRLRTVVNVSGMCPRRCADGANPELTRPYLPPAPADFFDPSGNVTSRIAAVFDPSLALYAVIVTVSPIFKSSRGNPFRFNTFGGRPTNDHADTLPPVSVTSR